MNSEEERDAEMSFRELCELFLASICETRGELDTLDGNAEFFLDRHFSDMVNELDLRTERLVEQHQQQQHVVDRLVQDRGKLLTELEAKKQECLLKHNSSAIKSLPAAHPVINLDEEEQEGLTFERRVQVLQRLNEALDDLQKSVYLLQSEYLLHKRYYIKYRGSGGGDERKGSVASTATTFTNATTITDYEIVGAIVDANNAAENLQMIMNVNSNTNLIGDFRSRDETVESGLVLTRNFMESLRIASMNFNHLKRRHHHQHQIVNSINVDAFIGFSSILSCYWLSLRDDNHDDDDDDNDVPLLPLELRHVIKMDTLNLAHNLIDSLKPYTFQCLANVRVLNLSDNRRLQFCDVAATSSFIFFGLSHLHTLDLSFNNLRTLGHEDLFEPIGHSLVCLNLKGNRLTHIDEFTFKHLHNLRTLILLGNSLEMVGKRTFQCSMPLLESLDMSGNALRHLDETLFDASEHLALLRLSYNKMKTLERGLFAHLSALRELNLKQHLSFTFVDKKRGLFSASSVTLCQRLLSSCENLEVLDMSQTRLKRIDPDAFRHCTRLKRLTLAFNHIQKLPKHLFEATELLEELDLSYNELSVIGRDTFASLAHLRVLNLRSNKLKKVDCEALHNLVQVKTIFLEFNKLSSLPGCARLVELEELDASHNRLKKIKSGRLPASLQVLHLQSNGIRELEKDAFRGLTQLRQLNLDFNKLERIQETCALSHAKQLLRLTLSHNRIKRIENGAFEGMTRLLKVNLSGNRLKGAPLDFVSQETSSLEDLDVSQNPQLKELPVTAGALKKLNFFKTSIDDSGSGSEKLFERFPSLIQMKNAQGRILNSHYSLS